MKKLWGYLLASLVCHNVVAIDLGSIRNTAVQKKDQFLHYWYCATSRNPEKYNCSRDTIMRGRRWLAETSAVVLTIILTAIGIKMTRDKMARIQKEQEQKVEQSFRKLQEQYYSLQAQITEAGKVKSLAVLHRVQKLQNEKAQVIDTMKKDFPKLYEQWVQVGR